MGSQIVISNVDPWMSDASPGCHRWPKPDMHIESELWEKQEGVNLDAVTADQMLQVCWSMQLDTNGIILHQQASMRHWYQ